MITRNATPFPHVVAPKGPLAPSRRTQRPFRVRGKFCEEQQLLATGAVSTLEHEKTLPSRSDRQPLHCHLLVAMAPTMTNSSGALAALLGNTCSRTKAVVTLSRTLSAPHLVLEVFHSILRPTRYLSLLLLRPWALGTLWMLVSTLLPRRSKPRRMPRRSVSADLRHWKRWHQHHRR